MVSHGLLINKALFAAAAPEGDDGTTPLGVTGCESKRHSLGVSRDFVSMTTVPGATRSVVLLLLCV